MLQAYVEMIDIEVSHWRNLQALMLDSAKGKNKIIILHDKGVIEKFAHNDGRDINRPISQISNAKEDARAVYEANKDCVDFVMILERSASDDYFRRIQDAWTVNDDIDEYVNRAFRLMGEYDQDIVTYPGPAKEQLGLQWRLGASYDAIKGAVESFVPAESTVVIGICEEESLWASLILRFDKDKRIDIITSVDLMDRSFEGSRDQIAKDMLEWAAKKYDPISLGLFTDLASAREFLQSTNKVPALLELVQQKKLSVNPATPALSGLIANT
ncbi:hypothetical protein [uncultured Cohaesibacter sp.]|uniref:hypothetical protein n=1 Tax=uncultured Cohaesibacter sp. TaxID=1002546 RepID=UPI00292FABA2|nr:hypothetical protein [uncultured Cohaesibacter sp.]